MIKKVHSFLNKFWKDESAQGMTEYILLVVVVIGLVIMFKGRIKSAMEGKMAEVEKGMSDVTTQ
jgi:Flp pilus assembly pilin Flp